MSLGLRKSKNLWTTGNIRCAGGEQKELLWGQQTEAKYNKLFIIKTHMGYNNVQGWWCNHLFLIKSEFFLKMSLTGSVTGLVMVTGLFFPSDLNWKQLFSFFKTIFGGYKSFCGATDTPVLDFWWHFLWISQPEWVALFGLDRSLYIIHFLTFFSDVTPADLWVSSMAAELFSSMYLQAGIGGAWNYATTASHCDTRKTFYQLNYASSAGNVLNLD